MEYYEKKLIEGKTKSQALVCVMRQIIRIVYSMMKNKSTWIEPTNKEKNDMNCRNTDMKIIS